MQPMRILLTLLAVGVLVAACSGNGAEGDTTTIGEPTTSTTPRADTTTAPAEPTTTTGAPATTATTASSTTPSDDVIADGSGCVPASDDLPDGLWYGLVDSFDESGISFDIACWYSGEAAAAAAAEDGQESPPPNDHYVRNQNEQLSFLEVADFTPVLWYPSGDPNESQLGTFAEWIDFLSQQESHPGIWVTITNGEVTQISEQWVP